MVSPILKITDGTSYVDLISVHSGVFLDNWTPAIAPLKGGGTYKQSVMADGRQLAMAHFDNTIETFSIKIRDGNQDAAIRDSQELLRLLLKARAYWFTRYATQPVWIEAKAPYETNTRYAIIQNFTVNGLDNPYALPFFNCPDAMMDEVVLALERNHWTAAKPTNSHCISITGSSSDATRRTIEIVGASADDVHVFHPTSSIASTPIMIRVGRYTPGSIDFEGGVRFSSVDLDDTYTVSKVYLEFTVRAVYGSVDDEQTNTESTIKIKGDDVANSSAWSTYANWVGRTRTARNGKIHVDEMEDWAVGQKVQFDITAVFNEIRDETAFTDGNAMSFFVEYDQWPTGFLVDFASYDHTTLAAPRLLIDYTIDKGVTTATCTQKVYACDKYSAANLTHIYVDDGGAFGSNLVASDSYNILPAVPAVNDAIYFGIQAGITDAGPFDNIVLNIETEAANLTTVIWEYYQGAPTSGWTQLTGGYLKDETEGLTERGRCVVGWRHPRDTTNGDWATTAVNGVTAWWVRARVTAIGVSPTAPVLSDEVVYSVTWPYVSIPENQILGDIQALGSALIGSDGLRTTGVMSRTRIIAAISSDRGPYADQDYNFSAYLPYSDEQLPSAIESISGVSGDFSYASDVTAPSGKAVQLNPSGTGTQSIYHTLDSSNFFGKYRVFMRVRQDGGVDGDFFVQVTQEHSSIEYATTREVEVTYQSNSTDPNWQLLDLGDMSIPAGLPNLAADENTKVDIYANIRVTSTTGDLYLCDLILMPSDEWIIDVQDFGTDNLSGSKSLYIDSIGVPKVDVRAVTKFPSANFANPVPWKVIGGQMVLPANKASKLWLLAARGSDDQWRSDPSVVMKIRLYKSERYLGMRGDR